MENMVVPYARFLEIRQRRQRVAVELTQQAVAPADLASVQVQSAPAADGAGGDDVRAARVIVRNVGTGATPDRENR